MKTQEKINVLIEKKAQCLDSIKQCENANLPASVVQTLKDSLASYESEIIELENKLYKSDAQRHGKNIYEIVKKRIDAAHDDMRNYVKTNDLTTDLNIDFNFKLYKNKNVSTSFKSNELKTKVYPIFKNKLFVSFSKMVQHIVLNTELLAGYSDRFDKDGNFKTSTNARNWCNGKFDFTTTPQTENLANDLKESEKSYIKTK